MPVVIVRLELDRVYRPSLRRRKQADRIFQVYISEGRREKGKIKNVNDHEERHPFSPPSIFLISYNAASIDKDGRFIFFLRYIDRRQT